MKRRVFLRRSAFAGLALATSASCLPADAATRTNAGARMREIFARLLQDWCDGLLRQQINEPAQPASHGAFRCPACGILHGRCGDAVMPLLEQAKRSGEARYLESALRVVGWMKNVDQPDGSWGNELGPNPWKGTTVFAAIALAESLIWHGDMLDKTTRDAWKTRLKKAGDFIVRKVTREYGNVNYPASGAYALALLGRLLDVPAFTVRGRELAQIILGCFTPEDHWLFGEGQPMDRRSAKGCYPVDLGYNVAESLPNLIQYALLENDEKVLATARTSLKTHLEFMLPDGGWDNSWGTRRAKWSYWGSRTADGCQSALVQLTGTDAVWATVALRNAELLLACTRNGLLQGGPHLAASGLPPCVHHTIVHAKAIAGALHHEHAWKELSVLPPLPRATTTGWRKFPEIEVILGAQGPWRATFSGYDWPYKPELTPATGGIPTLLWHEKLGPILTASLPRYIRVEAQNMQAGPPDGDFPLCCRVEHCDEKGEWFTNLHDLEATLQPEAQNQALRLVTLTSLKSAAGQVPPSGAMPFQIDYSLTKTGFSITVKPGKGVQGEWSLVVPVISPINERVEKQTVNQWRIQKPEGLLQITSNATIAKLAGTGERIFNLVPGFQAVPFEVKSRDTTPVTCELAPVLE